MNNSSGKKKRIEDYYREEHQYLIEAGREFSRANPLTAGFLNIDQIDDRDPYVERLFEGFAFLTGRIRQKLDDELPELTQSLLGLMWPHFLRSVPSLSILEFSVIPGRVKEPYIIEKNTEVDSQPVEAMGINPCRFRTCYDVHIRPIILVDVSMVSNNVIRFQFEIEEGVDYPKLFNMEGGTDYQKRNRRSIRLLIHDLDQLATSMLHLYLIRHVQKVVIQAGTKSPSVTIPGQAGVQFVGFSPEESLLPYTLQSFSGYRILQEYFSYPRKFLFFDLFGFDQLRPSEMVRDVKPIIEAQIFFEDRLPESIRFSTNNFRIHCTPIVNLSKGEAKPIEVNHEATEYKVQTSKEGFEVYSVDNVVGIVNSTMERRSYVPFYSFKHGLSGDGLVEPSDGYYHITTQLAFSEQERSEALQDTYISIVGLGREADEIDKLKGEILSIDITCTNGLWARELKPGDICNPTTVGSKTPEFIKFKNLIQPSFILYPPLQTGVEWRFISHLALNYLSLNNAEAMRGILELYNWNIERIQREANANRIASIINVSTIPREIPYRGSVIRGIEVTLEINKGKFSDEGDIHLFGMILREFLGLYVSINCFVKLTIVSHETKEVLFSWDPEIMNRENIKSLMSRRRLPL